MSIRDWLFRRRRREEELDEEVQAHLRMAAQERMEQGETAEQARTSAAREFGNVVLVKEVTRDVWGFQWFEILQQDLRFGARMLAKNPAFTCVAVLTLALGIGVNTAAFTAYKAFFGRSLDARDPRKMVNLALILHSGVTDPWFSYPDYEAYRDHLHSFSGLIAHAKNIDLLTLSGAGGVVSQRSSESGTLLGKWLLPAGTSDAEFPSSMIVSENYFSVLGATAPRGRTFESINIPVLAASPSVLISDNYWQKRFARDPAVLGKTIRLNGVAFTVIGITPHDFVGTTVAVPDFWVPLSLEPLLHADDHSLSDRENPCCRLFARLAPDVSMALAQAEMTVLADRLSALHDPHSDLGKPATALLWRGSPFPWPLEHYGGLKYAVLLIMAAVGMVLVIACANVASLQLARTVSRQNELCMRLSLGASRLRLVRQLLTESALLGLLAGGVALLLTSALLDIAVTMAAEAFPAEFGTVIFHVTPDLGIFGYVLGLSLTAGVLFGLAPALESSRDALSSALKVSAGTSLGRSRRLRGFLIAAQVAVSLLLMIAGSMLIHSSIRALKMDTGYETKHVVDLELQFPEGSKYTADRKLALVRELRTRLAALPGVIAIAGSRAPNGSGLRRAAVSLNGEKASAQNARVLYYTYVQANYFRTLGIPLLFGRGFQPQAGKPEPSVILSESAAKQLWPGRNPIGRSLRLDTDEQFHSKSEVLPDGPAYQVIGVARDTRGTMLDGSDSEQVYLPLPEDRLQDQPMLIRTQTDPAKFMGAIASVVSSVDPNLVATWSTLEEMLRQSQAFLASSLAAVIASGVGLLGLLLASMGIYSTVSYIVVLRTREVGIRMALGAKKRDIFGLILGESTRSVLFGLLAGMSLALGAGYLLRGVLYGLRTVDGVSFVGVSLLFLAIALVAAYLPSRRAVRVDPMVALRYE